MNIGTKGAKMGEAKGTRSKILKGQAKGTR